MVFANIDELLSMGGHGPYVWAAYLVTLAGLVALVVMPLLAQRRQLREIARRARRDNEIAANESRARSAVDPASLSRSDSSEE